MRRSYDTEVHGCGSALIALTIMLLMVGAAVAAVVGLIQRLAGGGG